jgi:hypothetical protein
MESFCTAERTSERALNESRFHEPHASPAIEQTVVVSDLSTGLKLSGQGLPVQAKCVCLKVGGAILVGRVAWSVSTDCGLAFD